MTSKIDQRRLNDGARALAIPIPKINPKAGIDELRAWNDMLTLEKRLGDLKATLALFKLI